MATSAPTSPDRITDQQRLRVDLSQQSKTLRGLAELYKKAARDKRIRLTEILDLFVFTPENNRRKKKSRIGENYQMTKFCRAAAPKSLRKLYCFVLEASGPTQRDYSRDILRHVQPLLTVNVKPPLI